MEEKRQNFLSHAHRGWWAALSQSLAVALPHKKRQRYSMRLQPQGETLHDACAHDLCSWNLLFTNVGGVE